MASIYDSNSAAKLLEERQASTNKNLLGLMNQNNSGRTQGEKAASSLGSLLAVLAGKALGGASDTSLVADAQASGEALSAAQAAGVGSEGSSYSPQVMEQLRKNDQDSLGLLGPGLRDAVTKDRANKQLEVSMKELSQLPPSEESYNKMAQLLSSAGHTEQAMAAYSKGAMLAEERKIAGVNKARVQENTYNRMVAQILTGGGGLITVPEAKAQVDEIMRTNPTAPTAPAPADTTTTTGTPTDTNTANAEATPLDDQKIFSGENIGVDEPWYNKLSDIDFGLPKDVWDGIVENTKLNARKQNK